ncbi:MAG: hypothetical protein ACRCSF_06430 [Mycobacteriaceae bacterium]
MEAKTAIKLILVLVFANLGVEVSFLAETVIASDVVYYLCHLGFMAALTVILLLFCLKYIRSDRPVGLAAVLVTCGLFITAVGDYVNSDVSAVESVEAKLSFALFLFGAGYISYCIALIILSNRVARERSDISHWFRYRYFLLIPSLAITSVSWYQHVMENVEGNSLLYYGSIIFNSTIYTLMPVLGFLFFYLARWNLGGLLVFIGSVFIPFSDLILFATWLDGGDEPVSLYFYSINFIVYFSGQACLVLFPAVFSLKESEAQTFVA